MTKELEALERLYCAGRLDLDYVLNGNQSQDYKLVEKALKALEIIKMIFLNDLVFDDEKQIISFSFGVSIVSIQIKDKTEYDLLKEVLK